MSQWGLNCGLYVTCAFPHALTYAASPAPIKIARRLHWNLLPNLLAEAPIAVHRSQFEKERMMKKTLAMALAAASLAFASATAAKCGRYADL